MIRLMLLLALALVGCTRSRPDATPEGAVRAWLETMESMADDPRRARDAYGLLGPAARANLEARAKSRTLAQGRRVEPQDMLAPGRFGLRFRPKSMKSTIAGDRATVEVFGDDPNTEKALVRCVRENTEWRIEPELPDFVPPAKRDAR